MTFEYIVTFKLYAWADAFGCIFFYRGFQMCPQLACIRGCITTLFALVCLSSTVGFQMGPHTICPGICIVTLVAFVRLFPAVCIQMSPQIECL